jgi:phosphonate transport system ATP-binding protein
MLLLEGLAKQFGDTYAVRDVNLSIPAGQFVGVIGRSGAGKSTLLRMINRLADPTAGRIVWQDSNVTDLTGRQLRDWRRRCAMVFQQFNLVGRLDVLNNVLLGRLAHAPGWRALTKAWPHQDRAMAFAALQQMDIAQLAPRRADRLSGGQQQRVAICRALVQEPDLLLADEPVASLDPRNSQIVMDALQRINRHFGITVLCNLHSLELARGYCDRLVGMAAGRVVFDDVPAALTDDAVRELYGLEADEAISRVAAQPLSISAATVPVGA